MSMQLSARAQAPRRIVVTAAQVEPADSALSPSELDDKYNPEGGGEHPVFRRAHWRQDVAGELTIKGYWEWVADVIQETQLGEVVLWH